MKISSSAAKEPPDESSTMKLSATLGRNNEAQPLLTFIPYVGHHHVVQFFCYCPNFCLVAVRRLAMHELTPLSLFVFRNVTLSVVVVELGLSAGASR